MVVWLCRSRVAADQRRADCLPIFPSVFWINVVVAASFDDFGEHVVGHRDTWTVIPNLKNFCFGERSAFIALSAQKRRYKGRNGDNVKALFLRHNGSAFNGRPGAEPHWNHKDRFARPVRCNAWLSRRRRAAAGTLRRRWCG
jgi:hypothetical protein